MKITRGNHPMIQMINELRLLTWDSNRQFRMDTDATSHPSQRLKRSVP